MAWPGALHVVVTEAGPAGTRTLLQRLDPRERLDGRDGRDPATLADQIALLAAELPEMATTGEELRLEPAEARAVVAVLRDASPTGSGEAVLRALLGPAADRGERRLGRCDTSLVVALTASADAAFVALGVWLGVQGDASGWWKVEPSDLWPPGFVVRPATTAGLLADVAVEASAIWLGGSHG